MQTLAETYNTNINEFLPQRQPSVKLASTALMQTVSQSIEKSIPDWEKNIRKYNKDNYGKVILNRQNIRGALSEIWLRNSVSDFVTQNKKEVQIDSLFLNDDNEQIVKKSHIFTKCLNGSIGVYNHINKKMVTDYDAFITINNIPYVFEIKMKKRRGPKGINNCMTEKNLHRVLSPLEELYPSTAHYGYFLVFPSNLFSNDDKSQNLFKARNGNLIQFPLSYKNYRKEVDFAIDKYYFNYKEATIFPAPSKISFA
jgi:hypothetical protein